MKDKDFAASEQAGKADIAPAVGLVVSTTAYFLGGVFGLLPAGAARRRHRGVRT